MTRVLCLTVSILAILPLGAVRAQSSRDISFDVSLRQTGKATIHARVEDNPSGRGAATILAVHGLTATGATFGPLADAIFADTNLSRVVRRMIWIDMPGHGESSFPTLPAPTRFSDLLIEDNVQVLIQSIDALRARRLAANVILGHSMGGLAIQAAQEALLAQGSSLARHGISAAILLSAVPARGSVWTMPPLGDLSAFIVTSDTALGPYLDLPPGFGPVFTTLSGAVVPNAPTPEEVLANDWIAIEPLTTLLELTGTSAPLWRPQVRSKAFSVDKGTLLSVISFSQDILTPAVDQDDLYAYLTGASGPGYRVVVADDAVHGMYLSNPQGLLGALLAGLR